METEAHIPGTLWILNETQCESKAKQEELSKGAGLRVGGGAASGRPEEDTGGKNGRRQDEHVDIHGGQGTWGEPGPVIARPRREGPS